MDAFLADLRYAFRNITRRPAFSILAVLTLAVGIGINTVAFTAVNGLLFHPFVFAGVDRLGWVMIAAPDDPHGDLSYAEFDELRRNARGFDAVAAEGRQPVAVMNGGRAEQAWALFVSGDYFRALGARPALGRLIDSADGRGDLAAVVSFRFWRSALQGGSIAGRTIVVANRTVSVVGVMPDDFQGPGGLFAPDLWLTLERAEAFGLPRQLLSGDERWLTTIARLAEGSSAARAASELTAIAAHLPASPAAGRAADRRLAFFAMREGHPEIRGLAPFVWIALAVVSVVLLIACFNVASLLLARAVERRSEIGIRTALGASRSRIVRQLVTEGVVLAIASGALALVLASWSERLLVVFSLPAPIPQRLHMTIDGRVIGFTLLIVLASGILPGLLPALEATRRDLVGAIRRDGSAHRSRTRRLFVVAQIAGSTLFLATAFLFVRSFANATRADLGFEPDHLIVARLEPALYGFDGPRTAALAGALRDRLAVIPGLTPAVVDRAPFAVGYPRASRVSTAARRCAAPDCRPTTFYAVDAHYLEASGIPIRAGRVLTDADERTGGVVVINEAMAAALWPGRSPLGEAVTLDDATAATVVGVVANTSQALAVTQSATPVFYRPIIDGDFANGFTIVTRTTGADAAASAALRDVVHAVAPSLPVASLTTMRKQLELPLWPRRTAAGFFAICGALALSLASVGLFAVTFFAVRQRTREFGIRMAVGAAPRQIVTQVLAESLRVVVPGTVAGLALSAIAGRLLARLLLGVTPLDPTSFASAAAIETAVAIVACAIPARDATRVDPLIALRAD